MSDKVEGGKLDEKALARVLAGSVLFGLHVTLEEAAERVRKFSRFIDDPELKDEAWQMRQQLLLLADGFVALSDKVDRSRGFEEA